MMQSESEPLVRATVMVVRDGKATVRLDNQTEGGGSGCGGCAHGSACGIGRLARRRELPVLQLVAPPGVQAGDSVHLLAPESGLSCLALLGYVWPAFALLLGAACGHFWGGAWGSDAAAAVGALLFFLLALGATRLAVTRCPALCSLSILPFSDPESSHEH
ncbi:MAG: SoxR reducing system RseC family protein [Zoogloeaceae bacterium]|jgi:positive regulator of sigma E activity|nr:SoxR reducing system RseC family protein [Zoogloeaceae bacterium]